MLALIMGLGAALAWGLHDILVRRISDGPNVLGQIMVIGLTGAPVLLVLSGADFSGLTAQAAGFAAAAGLAYVMAYVGLFRAFDLAPARLVSPVLGAYPMLSLLLAMAMGARVTLSDWLAVMAVVAGVALVALLAQDEDRKGGAVGPALAWAAMGATGFALTFALGQAASDGGESLAAGVITRLSGVAVTLGLILWRRIPLAPVRRNWAMLLAMGLLDTLALGLVMWAGGFPHAEYAAVAASLFGVVTILLAWALLGERVQAWQWPGIALVFAGIGWLAV